MRAAFRFRLAWWRYLLSKRAEKAVMWLVWRLPQHLVMWCAVRVIAHATTGEFGSTVVPELAAMDALKRWDDPRGGDPRGRRAAVAAG